MTRPEIDDKTLLAAALLLIKPGLATDLAGFALLGAVLAIQRLRPAPVAQPAS